MFKSIYEVGLLGEREKGMKWVFITKLECMMWRSCMYVCMYVCWFM